mmetsp:Transcript_65049/g.172262  ORF Transcript_65049/g.172262 Transcript_65049/m.172262 type:complete len:429 (-) Transcript_65049:16-1302(-)
MVVNRSLPDVGTLGSVEYWRGLCPKLHVDELALKSKPSGQAADDGCCQHVRTRILDEGFAALPPSSLCWSTAVSSLAEGALELERHGWPPTFLAVYDEAWLLARDATEMMHRVSGNVLSMDMLAFLVDPRRAKGFSPHRDRQPEDWMPRGVDESVPATFKSDGMAKYVTVWVALTDAHPDNSCLHFLPLSCDPGYREGDAESGEPMRSCFEKPGAFRNIRCEPVAAGGCTFHTHRTIHWGNCGRESYSGPPRISMSFGFSDPDFEPPYFDKRHLPFPPVNLRVALACAQVLNYATLSEGDAGGWTAVAGSMADRGTFAFRLLYRFFKLHSKAFHATYQKEIAKKFVTVTSGQSACAKGNAEPKDDGGDDSDDDVLDAMLDAERAAGEVMFHDDFDMLTVGDRKQRRLSDSAAQPERKRKKTGKCRRKK